LKIKFKIGLSLYILYHLYGVALAPNSQTYLGLRSAPFVEAYLGTFEFMSTWGFFAPEPGPPPIYVEWTLLDKNGNSLQEDRFPPSPDTFFIRERQNRRNSIVRFLSVDDTRIEKTLIPYLCRQNPGAVSVRTWRIAYSIPSPLEVTQQSRTLKDSVGQDKHWVGHSFCKEYNQQG
jgi:hypothetical protein